MPVSFSGVFDEIVAVVADLGLERAAGGVRLEGGDPVTPADFAVLDKDLEPGSTGRGVGGRGC